MGSVKELDVLLQPTENEPGEGTFTFSDDFSVFDWGKMPDRIPDKGAALCMMAAAVFEEIARFGYIETHYIGVVDEYGNVVLVNTLKNPSNTMNVKLVRVIKPIEKNGKYDYSEFENKQLTNYLIPLEVIYRNSLPANSSIFKRLDQKILTYYDLGLETYPKPGQILEKPYFDVTTKLESTDRYLSWKEAESISGLSDHEMNNMKDILRKVNQIISSKALQAGMINEDGKLEFGLSPSGELLIVDVVGTLDECRFTWKGKHVSKDIFRTYYKTTPWYEESERAKLMAKSENTNDWKQFCQLKPEPLPKELISLVSDLYTASANAFLGRSLFDVPPLERVMERYDDVIYKLSRS